MKLTDGVHLVGSGAWGFGCSDDLDCHVYLVDGGQELALIDAGAGRSPEVILANVEADGLSPDRIRYLLLTHAHADHAGGASYLRERLGLQVMASGEIAGFIRKGDEKAIGLESGRQAGGYPSDFRFRACQVDRELSQGQVVKVGRCEFSVVETPGHSLGCLSFLMKDHRGQNYLFCGDSLFFGGRVALQNIPDCNLQESLNTIRKLSVFPVDVFLPGHLCISLRSGHRHIESALGMMAKLGIPSSIT